MATDEKIIKDAQYRKGLGIAFFNATNSAISIVTQEIANRTEKPSDEWILTRVNFYRDYFLEQHKSYYASVIAGVGAVYNAKETIDKLKQVKTKDELRLVWISISEDERRDGEIIKVAKEIKASFN